MSTPRFRTRLAGQLLALLVPWSCFVVACLLLVFSNRAEQFQRDRDLQTTRLLAAECAPLAIADDLGSLARTVKAHSDAFEGLRYVLVMESSGELLWSTFAERTPAGLVQLPTGFPAPSTPIRVSLDGELIDDYVSRRSGLVLRAGYSVQPARDLALSTLPILLATGLVGLALVFALASYLSRPVEALSEAVASGASPGELRAYEAISETSEIAHRFDAVVDRLEERDRQLEASRRLAQLGEVSATIAHDVNNPLGVVVLNAGFLKRRLDAGQLPEASHAEVRRLWIAARRATMMVQRFLQIARWSTRPSQAVQRLVDVPALVAEAIELLEERARKAGVTVAVTVAEDIERHWCDEQGLLQVVMNLLSNALDASPAGGVVEIGVEVDEGGLVVTVADSGPGMAPEVLERATEPFFTTKPKGSGLGLAICDKIVRSHGGRLRVESSSGKGTIFRVELPQTEETG